jgi:large subunit ribosomal protein L21
MFRDCDGLAQTGVFFDVIAAAAGFLDSFAPCRHKDGARGLGFGRARSFCVSVACGRNICINRLNKKPGQLTSRSAEPRDRTRGKMFAVIKTGGKQYRVVAEDKLKVARVAGEVGDIVEFGEVLVVGGDTPTLGNPTVAGATVAAEVLAHDRDEKVIAFKKRRRKNSRRKRGHRQEYSLVRITEILTGGAKPSKEKAAPRKAKQPKETAAEEQPAA